jgi:hypothetical protein
MVTKYGFSEKLGPVNYSSGEEVFLGKDLSTKQNYSEEVANEIDEEVRAIIGEAYTECERILTEHKDQLRSVAEALLEVETLDGDQFVRLFDGQITGKELADELEAKEVDIQAKNRKEAEEMEKLEREYEDTIFSGPIKLAHDEEDSIARDGRYASAGNAGVSKHRTKPLKNAYPGHSRNADAPDAQTEAQNEDTDREHDENREGKPPRRLDS